MKDQRRLLNADLEFNSILRSLRIQCTELARQKYQAIANEVEEQSLPQHWLKSQKIIIHYCVLIVALEWIGRVSKNPVLQLLNLRFQVIFRLCEAGYLAKPTPRIFFPGVVFGLSIIPAFVFFLTLKKEKLK
jgi:hypothetical protein